ncbi:50S ribosomal protein L11 methyltransferase [Sulfurimonas sp.]|uniref:50S ribosomal protein L11 methyltransferase n=1 Tax=Sulfurimonas sp. TaxID=2022749 RepID=UPI0035626B0F
MQESYYELTISVSSHHELFADFLADTIPVGFEETENGFIVRSEDDLQTIAWGVEQFAQALSKALSSNIECECNQKKLKASDWIKEYQQSIQPIEIEKFYIHPTWDEPSDKLINIEIDPALAFGTGHHPTTASSLRAISEYVKDGDRVIDVGSGSGILGVGALKLGAKVDACDTDPVSVENTLQNAELNNVEFNKVWEGSCSLADDKYDVVVANIVADVLTFIAKDLKSALKDSGVMILSGILDKYEDKVLKFYKDMKIEQRIAQEEWVTLVLKKEN